MPFEIPDSWEWVRLEDYASIVTDFVASGSFASLRENVTYYKEENYAILVRTADFGSNFNKDLVYTDKHGYEFLENSNLVGGELILPNIGASIGKVFIVPKLSKRMTLGPNSILIRTLEEDMTIYLYYSFLSLWGYNLLHDISSATAQGKFNKTDLKKVILPIPPYFEQKRIIKAVKDWFSQIDNIDKDIADIQDAIKQTKLKVLDLAIHGKLVPQDPNDEPAIELLRRINPHFIPCDTSHYENLPSGWCVSSLKDAGIEILNGYAFQSKNYVPNGIKVIRITNVQDGYIVDDDPKYYPISSKEEIGRYLLHENDLLMSLTGNVGRVGFLQKELLPAALNQRVGCIRGTEQVISKKYLYYFLQSDLFKADCIDSAKGVAQLNISTEWLKAYEMPIPPIEEQIRLSTKIEQIFTAIDTITAEL